MYAWKIYIPGARFALMCLNVFACTRHSLCLYTYQPCDGNDQISKDYLMPLSELSVVLCSAPVTRFILIWKTKYDLFKRKTIIIISALPALV